MIRTVLLNTGSSPNMSKAGSGINILYLLTGPIMLKLTKMHGFYPFFYLEHDCGESSSSDHLHTELTQTKFTMGTFALITINKRA